VLADFAKVWEVVDVSIDNDEGEVQQHVPSPPFPSAMGCAAHASCEAVAAVRAAWPRRRKHQGRPPVCLMVEEASVQQLLQPEEHAKSPAVSVPAADGAGEKRELPSAAVVAEELVRLQLLQQQNLLHRHQRQRLRSARALASRLGLGL